MHISKTLPIYDTAENKTLFPSNIKTSSVPRRMKIIISRKLLKRVLKCCFSNFLQRLAVLQFKKEGQFWLQSFLQILVILSYSKMLLWARFLVRNSVCLKIQCFDCCCFKNTVSFLLSVTCVTFLYSSLTFQKKKQFVSI